MSPEEINKKIAELLHSRLNLINGELLSSEELQKEVEGAAKEIADMVFKEISALPTIKGWVARDGSGALYLYYAKPHREGNHNWWMSEYGSECMEIEQSFFPSATWEDEPIEVELLIIRK